MLKKIFKTLTCLGPLAEKLRKSWFWRSKRTIIYIELSATSRAIQRQKTNLGLQINMDKQKTLLHEQNNSLSYASHFIQEKYALHENFAELHV